MKVLLKTLFLLILISGCSYSEKQENKVLSNTEQKDWLLDCENKRFLITDTRNNFEINLDSINDYSDYVNLTKKKISDFVKQVGYPKVRVLDSLMKYDDNKDTLEVIFKDFDPHPQVFPFIKINDLQISLSQPLRVSSIGYFLDVMPLDLRTNNSANTKIEQLVCNYFINYKPVPKQPKYEYNQLTDPYVHLDITETQNISVCLEYIVTGYLKAITKISKDKYDIKYCDLNQIQIEEIKDLYPLKIRLTGDYRKEAKTETTN